MEYVFSRHSIEQMEFRNISRKLVEAALDNPDEILNYFGKKVYQSLFVSKGKNI